MADDLRALLAALAEPKPTFDEDWEQIKERLWDKWKIKGYQGEEFMYDSYFDQAMDEARAALAEGAGVYDEQIKAWQDGYVTGWDAAHPRPIPVAERLPTAADCDAEWRCWWWEPEMERWDLCYSVHGIGSASRSAWLPAAAIPLPEGEK